MLGALVLQAAPAVAEPPANDDFAAAELIVEDGDGSAWAFGDLAEASGEPSEPNHGGTASGHSAWYRWVAPRTGGVTVTACDWTGGGSVVGVYTGDEIGALTAVGTPGDLGCEDLATGGSVDFAAVAGTEYRIAVDSQSDTIPGFFDLSLVGRPPNDDFALAHEVAATGNAWGNLAHTTAEAGEPHHAGAPASHSAWYHFTASRSGPLTLTACNGFGSSSFDMRLAVYSGDELGELEPVAENDDAPGCGGGSEVTFTAEAGQAYSFAVDRKEGPGGWFGIDLIATPANDALADAEPLVGLPASASGENLAATTEAGEPQHVAEGGRSVWYRWTAPQDGRIVLSVVGYDCGWDGALSTRVYTGVAVDALTPVTLRDERPGCSEWDDHPSGGTIVFDAIAGTEYQIAVDGHGEATNQFDLTLRGPPANDAFANAALVFETTDWGRSNLGASKEPGEPEHGGEPGGSSVWFRWTASQSGPVTMSVCPSGRFDPLLEVYTGSELEHLTPVGADTPSSCTGEGGKSVTLTTVAGTEYVIAVDGRDGAGGGFDLETSRPPSNDDFDAAQLISGSDTTWGGTTTAATREAGEPDHAGGSAQGTVWYRWTAPADGEMVVSTCAYAYGDTALAVYAGADLASLEAVGDSSGEARCGTNDRGAMARFEAVAGSEYRIAVAGPAQGGYWYFNLRLRPLPAHDAFAAAEQLTGWRASAAVGTHTTGVEPGEPSHAGNAGGASVWYRWTAPHDGTATVQTCGSDFDTLLAVYTGATLAELDEVAAADDSNGCAPQGHGSRVTFEASAGAEYRIAVAGKNGAVGEATIGINPPANDAFTGAVELDMTGERIDGTLLGASTENGEPPIVTGQSRSVWYRFTATESEQILLGACSSSFWPTISLFTGSRVDQLSWHPLSYDGGGCAGLGSNVVTWVTAGTTYYIAINGTGPSVQSGDFHLQFRRPANDDFTAAQAIFGESAIVIGRTTAGGREPGEPSHAGDDGGASVWYRWTAPTDGEAAIATCGSDFDTLLGVYTGFSVGGLQEIAADDDSDSCGAGSKQSATTFPTEAGVEYLIAIDGRAGATGRIRLNLNRPPNDTIEAAAEIGPDDEVVAGTTFGATPEWGEPEHGGAPAQQSVWYRWTAPADRRVFLHTCDETGQPMSVHAYRAGPALTLASEPGWSRRGGGCSGRGGAWLDAAAGTSYLIAVDTPLFSDTTRLFGSGAAFSLHVDAPANDVRPAALTQCPFDSACGPAYANPLGVSPTVSGTNTRASRQLGDPVHPGSPGGRSVWYQWYAPGSGQATIDTCASDFDTLLAVVRDDGAAAEPAPPLDPPLGPDPAPDPSAPGDDLVAAADDGCGDSAGSRVTFDATAGTVYAIAVDGKAGATGTFGLRIAGAPDTTAPTTSLEMPSGPIATSSVSYRATANEPGSAFECSIDGGPFGPCPAHATRSGLEEREHSFAVRAVDLAGHIDPTPATSAFRVDLTPPETTIVGGPEGLGNASPPRFEFDANETGASFECAVDGGDFAPCSSPRSFPLPDGQHEFRVRATDAAGNADPTAAVRSFTLDRVPPETMLGDGPEGVIGTRSTSLTFESEPGAGFQCSLDFQSFAACESPARYDDLPDGDHSIRVRARDAAGNLDPTPARRDFTVDATPPESTIVPLPGNLVEHASPALTFFANEPVSLFECSLDGAQAQPCESPLTVGPLSDGIHSFEVRATDRFGKVEPEPARIEFRVDTTVPDTVMESGPDGPTNAAGPFAFAADEPDTTFQCAIDGGTFAGCATPFTVFPLTDGAHVLHVRAVDAAGHVDPTPAERSFTLDTQPPVVTATPAPAAPTAAAVTIDFTVDDPGARAECRLDGGGFAPCTTPVVLDDLADGQHTLRLRAIDAVGNVSDLVTRTFTIDTTPPTTAITAQPPPQTASRDVEIRFESNEAAASFRCSLDGAAATVCESPIGLSGLADGQHDFEVHAIDLAGNADATPAAASFVVDTQAPDTEITEQPVGPLHAGELGFDYSSTEAASFECAVDDEPFGPCDQRAEDLSAGAHTFRVRAIDAAQNVDPTPSTGQFSVVNDAPSATLAVTPDGGPAQLDATLTLGGEDADDDSLDYELQFGDGQSANGTLPTAPREHTYVEPGVYVARLEVSDGRATTAITRTVTVAPAEPLEARAGDDQTVLAGDPVLLNGADSRPLRGIDQYRWDLGDGTEAIGAEAEHVYEQPGDYEARLTTSRAGESATDGATIHVLPHPGHGGVRVTVRSGASPVGGADVLVTLPDGTHIASVSNGDGVATLHGLPDGDHTVKAYRAGYLPASGSATANDGQGEGSVELRPGEVGRVEIDSRPMTLDEIVAAGIDPNDPENRHVYEFTVHVDADEVLTGHVGGGGFIGGSCDQTVCVTRSRERTIYTRVTWSGDVPILSSLAIPFRASFLKEFYDVSLTVHNLADPEFPLRDGHATMQLPAGMSLAPTATPQALTIPVPDVPGGGSATAHWILRGDVEGEYDLAASYAATLEPFGRVVRLEGRTTEPIKVWGGSALELRVDVDEEARDGYPYTVRVGLANVADVPVHSAAVELLRTGRHGYIEQPRQRREFATSKIDPGETFWGGPFVIVPEATGEIDLTQSFIRKTAGDVDLDGTIVDHPREPSFDDTPTLTGRWRNSRDLVLEWEPVDGADSYEVYVTPDRDTDFPATRETVRHTLGATKAILRREAGDLPLVAVSSIVDGRHEMVHPLLTSATAPVHEYPSIQIEDSTRCGDPEAGAKLHFEDPDFELTAWGKRAGGGTPTTDQALSGHEAKRVTTISRPGRTALADIAVAVANANPDDAVKVREATLARCDYVALGDSFSSGEGAVDGGSGYEEGTESDNVGGNGNHCHRSPNAYPRVLAGRDDIRLLTFRACSGAVTSDIPAANSKNANEPPQIDAVQGADLVTLSMGGNDLDFAKILSTCIPAYVVQLPNPFAVPCKVAWAPIVESRISGLRNDLGVQLEAIREEQEGNPQARLILVGYPSIFPSEKPLLAANGCALLHEADVAWMHDMITRVNTELQSIALSAGAEFVDPNAGGLFDGADACAGPAAAFHALRSDGFENTFSIKNVEESFHPNITGQVALAATVGAKINHRDFGAVSIDDGQSIARSILVSGARAALRVSIRWPGSDVALSLESPSGEIVDRDAVPSSVTHERGATFETYLIPDPEPGEWTVTMRGIDVADGGEPVTLEIDQAPQTIAPPVALYKTSADGDEAPLAVTLDGRSSFDPAGRSLVYDWDLGDGAGASGALVEHVYTEPGSYTPELTVTAPDGQSDRFALQPIVVKAAVEDPGPGPGDPGPSQPGPGDPGPGGPRGGTGDPNGSGSDGRADPVRAPGPAAAEPLFTGLAASRAIRYVSSKGRITIRLTTMRPNVALTATTWLARRRTRLGRVTRRIGKRGGVTLVIRVGNRARRLLAANSSTGIVVRVRATAPDRQPYEQTRRLKLRR